MTRLTFPKGFLWGAATSAHQVEGGTTNNWSEWENTNAERLAAEAAQKFGHIESWQEQFGAEAARPENYLSGTACDHYHRYSEDFALAKELGHNAHRFSVEWSRVEPEDGVFDETVIAHYVDVVEALRARGLEPFVTLWHWTHPLWLEQLGGCATKEFPTRFARFADRMVRAFGERVRFYMTLNEPTSVIGNAYINGNWPPQKKSFLAAHRVMYILARAHREGYQAIKAYAPDAAVGFGNILQSFEPYRRDSLFDKIAVRFARYFTNKRFLDLTAGCHDYLTVQYYFHSRLRLARKAHIPGLPHTDLGWEIYPHGLFNILRWLKSYGLPVYITECGLADADDSQREHFIRDHLAETHRAIGEGVDVRGFFYWSLLDNFEWDKGFWPRFGLVHVDYDTQARTPRPSALAYKKICVANGFELPDEHP
jgi:beta-glucosidase